MSSLIEETDEFRLPYHNKEAISLNEIIATSSNPRFAVDNQNITQCPHWDEGTLVTRRFNESPGDPIVAINLIAQVLRTFIQLVTRRSSHSPIASSEEPQAYFLSDIESQSNPASNRRLPFLGRGFNEGAYSLNVINSRYFHSYNQNITQISIAINSTREEEQPRFNRPRLIETFLAITSQTALTLLTIRSSGNTSFSESQKILFFSSAAFNVIGFLSFMLAILLGGGKPGIARIVKGTGFICTAYGFIGMMGMLLKGSMMLWVTGLAGIALFPVFASSFMREILKP